MLTGSCRLRSTVFLLTSLALGSAQAGGRRHPTPHTGGALDQKKLTAEAARLPLSFEANQGQTDGRVRYLSRGEGYTLFLTSTEAVLALRRHPLARKELVGNDAVRKEPKAKRQVSTAGRRSPAAALQSPPTLLRMQLVGANSRPKVTGTKRLPGQVNYLLGRDPRKWHTRVPTYREVRYEEVYPGVDLVYYGNQRQLEYDFVVAPGADPRRIRLAFAGAKQVEVVPDGELVLHTPAGEIRQRKPLLYQEIGGVRREVEGSYRLMPAPAQSSGTQNGSSTKLRHVVSFQIGRYDPAQPLVIDPVLSYSTFLGGDQLDQGVRITVDAEGNAYVTGRTTSRDFPVTSGAFDTTFNRGSQDLDAFVTKLDASGTTLLYSTYLGGSGPESGTGIAVDALGRAYVTGSTNSADFPTTPGAFDTHLDGTGDAFVTKLNAAGSGLVYSTLLGGSASDVGAAITVDAAGSAYVTGGTQSADFPATPGAFDTSGTNDAFVAKLNASGSALLYATYLGGMNTDSGQAIVVDAAGRAYLTGNTDSQDFPTTPGAFDTSFNGGDAFASQLNATGSALVYSTYLGGNSPDIGFGVAVDPEGNVYVTGATQSADFPTTLGAFDTSFNGGPWDAFVTKLDPTGATLRYSTFLGGSNPGPPGSGPGDDRAAAIRVNSLGQALVTGITTSRDFPTTPGAFDRSLNGGGDAFLTQLNVSGSALVSSTFLGGQGFDEGEGIALDPADRVYVTGRTSSADFPTTPGAFDTSYNDQVDAFVVKFGITLREQIEAVIRQVEQLVAAGTLQPGDGAALIEALQDALRQLDQGRPTAASERLRSFLLQVGGLIRTGKLSSASGALLIDAVQPLVTQLAPATFTVTNTRDSGPGSLRAAIEAANASPSADTILFRIPASDPGFGAGVFTIRPATALPAVQSPTFLDAVSQLALTGNTNPDGPEIVLDGSSAGRADGLELSGTDSVVRGFVVQGFSGAGIRINGDRNRVEGCYLGTNAAGTVGVFNGFGVYVFLGGTNIIGSTQASLRNVISGNVEDGIHLDGAFGTVVLGNLIGTNALGTAAIQNNRSGILLRNTRDIRVGGTEPGSRNLISGNGLNGITMEGGVRVEVQGNYIGTNALGTTGISNGGGVSVNQMDRVLIGGPLSAARNVISGNRADGVVFTDGTSNSQIQGNYLGLNAAGTAALPNGESGVQLEDGTDNLVGGTTAAARNIISGNAGDGVTVLFDAERDLIQGNYIGTNPVGRTGIPNGGHGIQITDGAQAIQVGGTESGARNLISGNALDGVRISGERHTMPGGLASAFNSVQGNLIGTDYSGSRALSNGQSGVNLDAGTTHNTVGGTTAGARNLISGNLGNGVALGHTETQNNLVVGNFIGTNLGGTAAVPNHLNGVEIGGARNNRIGGTTENDRNLISGNSRAGIYLNNTVINNLVAGNYIGTNASGSGAVANLIGVLLSYTANAVIGGSEPHLGNLISGNRFAGIAVEDSTRIAIRGNLIGTNAAGTAALPNLDGISLGQSTTIQIGGVLPAERNVISGNRANGIDLGPVDHVLILGNYIGVNAAGTSAIPNAGHGVGIYDRAMITTIGGADPGSRNVISGNRMDGVFITEGSQEATVLGNYIGTNALGAQAIPNGRHGVEIFQSEDNRIGGPAAGAGNVISGNGGNGIFIGAFGFDFIEGNTIQGNLIGTRATGSGPLPNGGHGVAFQGEALRNNPIGGIAPGAGNQIAYNVGDGIQFTSTAEDDPTLFGNPIRANSIHDNRGLGINLRPPGEPPSTVTPNDFQDPDPGPNRVQNFPVLTSAGVQPGSTTLTGTLNSTPNSPFALDFFRSPAPDPSGFGEGQQYLGSTSVTTDASGNASFTFVATGTGAGVSGFFTATATNTATQDTGEFSAALPGSSMTLAAGGFPAGAQVAGPGQIAGQVTDASGAGLAGVRLSLQPPTGGELYSRDWDPGRLQVVYTEAGGTFRFSGLPRGRYLVLAYAPGVYFTPRAQWVEVGAAGTPEVIFTAAGTDQEPPRVTLEVPVDGPGSPPTHVQGTVVDQNGAGVRAVLVRLALLDPEGGQPERWLDWPTGTWDAKPAAGQTRWAVLEATGTGWKLDLPHLAPGTYRLEVQAYDWAGYFSPRERRVFEVR